MQKTQEQKVQSMIEATYLAEGAAIRSLQRLKPFTGARMIALELGYCQGTPEYRIAIDVACKVFEQYTITTNKNGIIEKVVKKC